MNRDDLKEFSETIKIDEVSLLKGGTTLIAQLSWVIYLTLPLTRDRPATNPQV